TPKPRPRARNFTGWLDCPTLGSKTSGKRASNEVLVRDEAGRFLPGAWKASSRKRATPPRTRRAHSTETRPRLRTAPDRPQLAINTPPRSRCLEKENGAEAKSRACLGDGMREACRPSELPVA